MTATRTTCPYCGVGCGVLAYADGRIEGDPDHPANFGRLCSKGRALGETIGMEGRLLAPRAFGQDTSWDSALDLVAGRFKSAVAEHGPDSVALYVSGQILTEDYYVANKLMKGYIGSANIDTNSRLCMASSVAGHRRAFGTDTVPGTYEDLEQADLLVLVGSNLAWCHPVLYQRIAAAKEARPDMRVVVIDPRRTASCDIADLHLPIKSDGDIALFNGLLAHLDRAGAVDDAYLAHVNGFEAALTAAQDTDPAGSGLSTEQISAFYEMFTQTPKVVTVYSQGVNQSVCGTDKVNAILNCHLATGRIGQPGMGPFSITGQPNAMGGREVGGLANMLGWHLDLENAAHRDAVQAAWGSPAMADKPGLKAIDLFQACASGKIKALWVMSTNPVVSLPEADSVADAIKNVPFVVVSDILESTDTGDLADVLLPATGWGEKSGTVTNSERRISRQRPFLPTPTGARADWWQFAQVGQRMGFEGFDWATEADVFGEYAQLSSLARDAGRDFDITGLAELTRDAYDALEPVQWPVPAGADAGGRFFADGGFFHADGKAKMLPVAAPALPDHALTLNTGRIRDQWHTMSRTARAPRLNAHLAEPFVEIHPEDAVAHGLRAADLAEVSTEQGTALVRVLVSASAQKGAVFLPMHWTAQNAPAGRANPLVAAVTDPFSGQPASKSGAVAVKKADMAWFGFAVSMVEMEPTRPYAAVAPVVNGWKAEVAGYKLPTDWEAEARAVTAQPDAAAAVVADPKTGLARVAFHSEGRIVALFFAAPHPVEVARTHVIGLLGQETSPLQALAARAGADRPDPGPTICACFDVGRNTLQRAVVDGANSVEALGVATCAGTGCGSCKPELAALLIAPSARVAAE